MKTNLTISIATYKAENNILELINSLLSQRTDFSFHIVVHCDKSGDRTFKFAKSIKNKKVTVVKPQKRRGFGGTVEYLVSINKSDYLVILNDDIYIKDKYFIQKLIHPLMVNKKIGFATGNPQPFLINNFLQRAINTSFRSYELMRKTIKNGSNKFTCDGKVMVFSRDFAKKITFPKNKKLLANVDTYLYFENLRVGYQFKFLKNAIVYFKFPATLKDYIDWNLRNNSSKYVLYQTFGNIVYKESQIPLNTYIKHTILESIKNPLGATFLFILHRYTNSKAKDYAENFNPLWKNLDSTKKFDQKIDNS